MRIASNVYFIVEAEDGRSYSAWPYQRSGPTYGGPSLNSLEDESVPIATKEHSIIVAVQTFNKFVVTHPPLYSLKLMEKTEFPFIH